jgi:peptidoglycan hydrolase FlgJ
MYRGMLDQQIAQQVAASGTGLSDMIARQLSRNLPGIAGDTAAPAASAPNAMSAPLANAPQAAASAAGAASTDVQRAFLQQHWSDAVSAQQLTGVPASFILGQAALESGWGQSEIRGADGQPSYNLFGIKAGPGWQGRTVQVTTTEYQGGVPSKSVQSFRAYDSYAAAFQDWAQTIGRNQRYSAAVTPGSGAGGFALGMQQAGYSTDPAYAQKLARVIQTASSIGGSG